MFIAALFTIAKNWKQLRCPSIDEWLTTEVHIHAKEHYSAIKRNKLLTHETTQMHLPRIILGKTSQLPKATYYMIPYVACTK